MLFWFVCFIVQFPGNKKLNFSAGMVFFPDYWQVHLILCLFSGISTITVLFFAINMKLCMEVFLFMQIMRINLL